MSHSSTPFTILQGDCLSEMSLWLGDNSVDAIVTDPPYGLSFMSKHWDYDVPGADVWAECLRVLKPGGHLLSFFGSRTYHRGVAPIEDAGFEIRDQIMWVYGSGFPKSHNGEWGGTALKPSHEPIVVARKPLVGTVEANWLAFGTGALNIDGCRVAANDKTPAPVGEFGGSSIGPTGLRGERNGSADGLGRWPANLIHDGSDEVVAAFPQANHKTGGPARTSIGGNGAYYGGDARVPIGYDDAGSAARFFYCAKASKRDRDEGLEGFEKHVINVTDGHGRGAINTSKGGDGVRENRPRANIHPTVKPTDLMAYLCRLVTPPGGVVLDPFMGSGSTGKAAMREGFRFIGIEREAEYAAIARARIAAELGKRLGVAA